MKKVLVGVLLFLGCVRAHAQSSATIWFYQAADSGQTRTIYQIGGITDSVAAIGPGEFFGLQVSPGVHVFSFTRAPARGQSVAVSVNQGQQAYVELRGNAIEIVAQEKGIRSIQTSRPISASSTTSNNVIVAASGPATAGSTASPVSAPQQTAVDQTQAPQTQKSGLSATVPRIEAFGGYSFINPDVPGNILPGSDGPAIEAAGDFILGYVFGWGGSATVNINRFFGITGDVSNHRKSLSASFEDTTGEASLSVQTFLFGPTFKIRKERVEPFFHALFGVARPGASASGEDGGDPFDFDYRETGFAMAWGGGLDVLVNDHIAIRPLEADYFPYRTSNGDTFTFHNIRWRSGVVFRFGK